MHANWLSALAHDSLGNFDATSEIDQDLSRRALLARDDVRERDALFLLLSWKIERFAGRYRGWRLDPWELDDVIQETYPVYLETLHYWTPRYVDGEPAGYLFYFLRVYPYWLMNAVHRWRRPASRTVSLDPAGATIATATPEQATTIDVFCRRLHAEEASLLRHRLATGASIPEAAEATGLTRRTAYRRWRRLVQVGREHLREAG
jgi:transposase-like protein